MNDAAENRRISRELPQAFTVPQLARLVRQMRQAQNRYFDERSRENLDASKAIERTVDEALRRILDPSLF